MLQLHPRTECVQRQWAADLVQTLGMVQQQLGYSVPHTSFQTGMPEQ